MRVFRTSLLSFVVLLSFTFESLGQELSFLEVSDGAKIAYRVVGQGPPVVFIHGFLGNMDYWSELIAPLTDDFTMVTFDLRGHGHSTNPVPEFSHERFGHDAAEVMSFLGFDTYGVVGHSSGGTAAYHLSSNYPARVNWQIVMGSAFKHGEPQKEMLRNFPAFEELEEWIRDVMINAHPGGRQQIDRLLDAIRDIGTEREDLNFTASDLSTIFTPTLVIWGDREQYPVETAVYLYRNLPNAWLWVVPGVGHQIFWPENGGSQMAADEFIPRIRAFASDHQ